MPKMKLNLDALQVESCDVMPRESMRENATKTDFFSFPCCPATGDVYR